MGLAVVGDDLEGWARDKINGIKSQFDGVYNSIYFSEQFNDVRQQLRAVSFCYAHLRVHSLQNQLFREFVIKVQS